MPWVPSMTRVHLQRPRIAWVLPGLAAAFTVAACASGADDGAWGDAGSEAGSPSTSDASQPQADGATGHHDAGSGHDGGSDGHPASGDSGPGTSEGGAGEASVTEGGQGDAAATDTGTTTTVDSGSSTGPDAAADASTHDSGMTVGPVTGGPCVSGAPGATAIRIEFIDAHGTADVRWLAEGMPDRSNDSAGAYGYTIPFSPPFVDPYLGAGGVGVDDSDFIDVSLSTVGLSSITSATLSIYGRSYDVSASASFWWQTFDGVGQTPTDFVSNVAPYQWYSADMTTEIGPGEGNVLIRIKAGPSSDSLVVNQVELCVVAN